MAELRTQQRPILIGLACTSITAALYAATIPLTRTTFDAIGDISKYRDKAIPHAESLQQQALQHLQVTILVFVALFAARYWFSRGQVYFLSSAANKLATELRIRMFRKLLSLPVSYFNERRSGAIQSVLTNDVNVYQNAVMLVRDSIDGPIKVVFATATLFWMQPQLALIALLVMPALVAIIQRNARKMRKTQTEVQEDLAELSATSQEVLQGARVVKAFGAENRMASFFETAVQRSYESQMRAVTITASLRPLVELIGACAMALLLYMGGYLAMNGNLNVGTIAAMGFAMDAINQGFRSLAGVSNAYSGVQAASDRIYSEVLDVPTAHEALGDKTIDSPKGQIEFENVCFTYPDGTEALSNVTFTLAPGESLALVGPSGAGKSTIADLLLRFYDPTAGRITFDGVDLKDLDVAWLRSQIGVVPQHTFLFAGSIEDNVRLGAPEATEADLKLALKQSHAEEFTSEMQDRTVSELGERGVRLSGGQMQRIAIARAVVRKPAILLLDEATSALDPTSEKIVTEALEEVMKDRTTLFIAHRLTTAARADKIAVLRRGEIVEQGSHQDLMSAGGVYAGLFKAFSGGVLD
ncbi:MAG: ABC transporter ATP-binding protein [Fimbriimonas sp.]